MIATNWRTLSRMTLLVAVLAMMPGVARAADPHILSLEVFGDSTPEANLARSQTLFASSTPWGRGASDMGLAWVRGKAGAGSVAGDTIFVDISVDDDLASTPAVTKSVPVENKLLPDGSTNPDSGAFLTSINVTDLGTHIATGDKTAGHGGASVLTFTVQARRSSNGQTGSPAQATLTKYAGTRYDAASPLYETRVGSNGAGTARYFPPSLWCKHRASSAPYFNNGGMENFTAAQNGCPSSGTGLFNQQVIAGTVTDERNAPFGIFSEIGGVTITITGGTLTSPMALSPSLVRRGPGASYQVSIYRDQFEPTFYRSSSAPLLNADTIAAPAYTITVTSIDAWGQQLTATSTFDVCAC